MNKKILVGLLIVIIFAVAYFILKSKLTLDYQLQKFLTELENSGVTKENMAQFDMSKFRKSGFIEIDQRGYIQVEITFWRLNSRDILKLKQLGAEIEIKNINQKYHTIETRIPFYQLESVARLLNVTQVKLPAYAFPA